MKKIITLTFGLFLAFSTASTVFAQSYYSYNNSYSNGGSLSTSYPVNYRPSYTYTQGCYTYYYNGYTQTTSIASYNCQNQNTYSYTNPVVYTYYTLPYIYNTYYTQPSTYYTYGYSGGSWYPRYNNSYLFGNNSYNNSNYYYNNSNGHVNTPTTNCYHLNGGYACE